MKSLTERLLGASKSKYASTVNKSIIFADDDSDKISFDHPILNVIYSGSMRGGFHAGNTTWAGPSKHFKSLFSLMQAKAYLKAKHKGGSNTNAKIVLIDSEFGMPVSYFESVGINPEDVIHIPITNIEEMKTETVNILNELDRGDEVIFVIDSIGNLASIKEVQDAEKEGASPADMTRAKQLKSYFRIVTPMFKLRNIGLIVVNHTYQTLEMFSKTVLGGGTGNMYAADNIFFLGRRQDAKGTGASKVLNGYDFVVKVEKSRFIREGSQFIVNVGFETGLQKYTGMFELMQTLGLMETKGKKYELTDPSTGEVLEGHSRKWYDEHPEFWAEVVKNDAIDELIRKTYRLGENKLISDEEDEDSE